MAAGSVGARRAERKQATLASKLVPAGSSCRNMPITSIDQETVSLITNLIRPPIVLHASRCVRAESDPSGAGYAVKRLNAIFFRLGNSVWPRQVADGAVNNGVSVDLNRQGGSI